MPRSWADSSASAICLAIPRASAIGNGASGLEMPGEGRTVHQLHHQPAPPVLLLEAVERRDVRVIQRSEHLRLPLEAGQAAGIGGHRRRQHLDRHVADETRVVRPIDLAHSSGADQGPDLVHAQPAPRAERRLRCGKRGLTLHESPGLLLGREQRADLVEKSRVARARLGQERVATGGLAVEGPLEQLVDAAPALGARHASRR